MGRDTGLLHPPWDGVKVKSPFSPAPWGGQEDKEQQVNFLKEIKDSNKKSQACAFPAGGAEEREAEEWEDVAESGGAHSAWLGCGGPAPGVQSSVCPHVSPAWSPALLWHLQPLALVSFAVSPLGIPSRADPGVAQSQLPPRQRKPCTHCREVFHL